MAQKPQGTTLEPQPIAAPAPAERPEWIDETPRQNETYVLDMVVDATAYQDVELTRAEFIALKHHLARMRSFEVEDEEEAV